MERRKKALFRRQKGHLSTEEKQRATVEIRERLESFRTRKQGKITIDVRKVEARKSSADM